MNQYSILVQGPLDKISLDQIESYKQFGKVVISYWDSDDESMLDGVDTNDCLLIKKKKPDYLIFEKFYRPYRTLTYQLNSIYNGLCGIETEFTIRTRSDEFFNLGPLIEKFERVGKVVCGNIFFRRWDNPFHIGDHLFIGKTGIFKKAYFTLLQDPLRYSSIFAEGIVAMSMLEAANLPLTKEGFLQLFDVMDINELAPFVAQSRGVSLVFQNKFEDGGVIKHIHEL